MAVSSQNAVVRDTYGYAQPNFGGTLGVVMGSVAYNETTVKTLGNIPAGAIPIFWSVSIATDFNSATTDVLKIGLGSDDDYLASGVDLATQAVINYGVSGTVFTRIGVQLTAEDTFTVTYSNTGTAATTGLAYVSLWYIVQPLP